jgi:electron transfer flavoprotein beta subunit
MKIVVAIKETLDLNSVDIDENEYLPKDFDTDDIVMNTNDKHAIEAALQIKEKIEGTIVHVLCFGSENALKILREAIAMGCDEGSRIDADDIDYAISSMGKSMILANEIKKHNSDLIITGMYSTDFGQAQVPVLLASMLNLPQITYVNTLEISDRTVIADRYIEGGSIKLKVPIPCVLSIASTANEPRYTSVKRIMLAKKTEIPVISLDDIEIDKSNLKNMGEMELLEILTPEKSEIECFKVEEDDVEVGVDKLLTKIKNDGLDLTIYKN